ncbi:MAG: IclR family transcriptional regulator [Gemmatimonadetes bacterium]|nr:IclR family transcriptional regulator [Gemmatimonadota bacterium]NNM06665.1 IclR family transcriptional regulator [Gemmatimonadota bacterium]
MSSPEPIPGTRAVQRVLSLLSAFSDERSAWTLTELSEKVGLSKATAHRMLGVLEQEGFVVRRSGSGAFQLGPEMIVLGVRALKAVDVRAVARSELRFLAESTGADASLESLVGSEVLILDEERGQGLLALGTEVGTRWPAHATATGKVLLAGAEGPTVEPPGELQPLTAHTITSWSDFIEALSEVREKGFATNLEELEYGYISVAAPVRDSEGRTTAALSVGGPSHRMTADRIPELAKVLQEAASRVSERLGYRRRL